MKRVLILASLVLIFPTTALADPPSVDTARRRTAQYERNQFGARIIVRVSSECPVVATNTRRCYFTVDPTFWARRCRAPYVGWNGYVRVRDEGDRLRTWETVAWCAFA